MQGDTVTGNAANGGPGGYGYPSGSAGQGEGGGLYIVKGEAKVSPDAFTVANVIDNTASTSDPNIDGKYTIIP
jgi:hypothetical protein